MVRRLTLAGTFAAVAFGSAAGQEPSAWIVDRLSIPVYSRPELGAAIVGTLETGTPVTVEERKLGFARVTGPISLTGWVESVYVTDSKPGRLLASELEGKREEANARIRVLRNRTQTTEANARTRTEALVKAKVELAAATDELAAAATRESRLKADNRALRDDLARLRAERMLLESRLEDAWKGHPDPGHYDPDEETQAPPTDVRPLRTAMGSENGGRPPEAANRLGVMDGLPGPGLLVSGLAALACFVAGLAVSRIGFFSRRSLRRSPGPGIWRRRA